MAKAPLMQESSSLEFKEKYSKTFLKTVSAYANFGDGKILFGVNDKGIAVGLADPAAARLSIENAINEAIDPRPNYSLRTETTSGKSIVELSVLQGTDKPYLCSGKAYRRADTSTVAVDRSELRRLAIEGSPFSYDEMRSYNQTLTFNVLKQQLNEQMGIKKVTQDTLKTLGLFKDGYYNNAAALLADTNDFSGLDVVRYAYDDESIHERKTFDKISVLSQLELAVKEYRKYYVVQRIEGIKRKTCELIPEKALREALANALVHRVWYTNAQINVSFYSDKIEIVSPGGLPAEIDEELYLKGGVSIPRNACLAFVFLRLGIIERLGTGIRHIKNAYENSSVKPLFDISANAIRLVLPVLDAQIDLSAAEENLLSLFQPGLKLTSAEMEKELGASRATVVRTASSLIEKGALKRFGKARSTYYCLP